MIQKKAKLHLPLHVGMHDIVGIILNGWERYDPIIGGNNTLRTRSANKPWYSQTIRRPCRHPQDKLAAVTIHSSVMDGDLFTITWSAVLPTGYLPITQPLHEATTPSSTSSEAGDDLRIPEFLPRILDAINASKYFKRLIGPFQPPTEANLLDIANAISTGTLLVCSDGSFCSHSGTGSHAWLFSTSIGVVLFQGAGPIDCFPYLLSSYRPELGGITALLFLLSVLTKAYDIAEGSVTLFAIIKAP